MKTAEEILEERKNTHGDFEKGAQSAWDEIKDRKGRMIDGVFVKEEDLNNE